MHSKSVVANTARNIELRDCANKEEKNRAKCMAIWRYLVADVETRLTEMCASNCAFFRLRLRQTSETNVLKTTFALGIPFFLPSICKVLLDVRIAITANVCKRTPLCACIRKQVSNEFLRSFNNEKSQRSSQIHFSSHPNWLWRPTFD